MLRFYFAAMKRYYGMHLLAGKGVIYDKEVTTLNENS